MTREDAHALVNHAVDAVVANDSDLLRLDVTERALSHQLARYMADRVAAPLAVDCEYNRHGSDTKRLRLGRREASDHDLQAVIVFPDIIVHQRGTDDHNLLVVEVKKPGEPDRWL